MPLYSYECPRGHKFDKIVPIAKMDDYQECPGKLAEPPETDDPNDTVMCDLIDCRGPAKRIPVPSRPAHIIIR
jgi:hypothetical protein